MVGSPGIPRPQEADARESGVQVVLSHIVAPGQRGLHCEILSLKYNKTKLILTKCGFLSITALPTSSAREVFTDSEQVIKPGDIPVRTKIRTPLTESEGHWKTGPSLDTASPVI